MQHNYMGIKNTCSLNDIIAVIYSKTKIIHSYTFKALMLSSFVCFILIPCECESSFLLFHLNWEVLMIFGFLAEAVFIRLQAD